MKVKVSNDTKNGNFVISYAVNMVFGVRENTFSTLIEASFNRKGIRYFVYNIQPHNMT